MSPEPSLDKFLGATVVPIAILAESDALKLATQACSTYIDQVKSELDALESALSKANLPSNIRLNLIYVPLGNKTSLVDAFDERLKGLQ